MTTVHVIGAGLAGLACAVRLAQAGRPVALYEAARHAGGRCRSFFEPALERTIDNGNHLLLGANDGTMAYLDAIGARGSLLTGPTIAFPFVDLVSEARWTVRPNPGRLPWWLLAPNRRVPDSGIGDYLAVLRLARAGEQDTIDDALGPATPFFERFWRPLIVAVINTETEAGSARLMWPVMRLTFGSGGAACRPYMARDGLSASLVEPAVAWLAEHGCAPTFGRRLRRLVFNDGRIAALDFGDGETAIEGTDRVVLAVPPPRAAELVPDLVVPTESRAIVNAHFRLAAPVTLPDDSFLLGLIGGAAQWLFLRGDVVSVTVSAADARCRASRATRLSISCAARLRGPVVPRINSRR